MMKFFATLFPYKLHLHILQLEEYDEGRFLHWLVNHYFKRHLEQKKPLVLTQKAKLILAIAVMFNVLVVLLSFWQFGFLGLVIALILSTQSYLFLAAANYIIKPIERWQKNKIKSAMRRKIQSLSNLKVIGVAGSYGKTSVKEFLYQMLKTKYRVLRTPENYNTMLGIAKVVDLELDDSYDYFICEIGAYQIGDIKHVCEIVAPQYGILTGINEQHLERFGTVENTTQAKFEIIDCVASQGTVANGDNEIILTNYKNHNPNTILYGFSQANFSITNVIVSENGSRFDLIIDGINYPCQTKLIGRPNLQNILGAATMAFQLGIEPREISDVISKLNPVTHRLEIKHHGNGILIDDAYSANVTGFREALTLLKSFSRPKILATPGIVELGEKTVEIHKKLGVLADEVCDTVILIGKSNRTKGIESGLQKLKPIYIDSVNKIWSAVEELGYSNPVVLLENDLPENY